MHGVRTPPRLPGAIRSAVVTAAATRAATTVAIVAWVSADASAIARAGAVVNTDTATAVSGTRNSVATAAKSPPRHIRRHCQCLPFFRDALLHPPHCT